MKTSLNRQHRPNTDSGGFLRRNGQVLFLAALLLGVNWPLFTGGINTDLIFFPEAVGDGQWWRVLSYPLVHLSWYHLLLDGGAFLLLVHSREDTRFSRRLAYLAGAGICSLSLALALEPSIAHRGLCGLSGIAHGLMAVTGLEMMAGGKYRSLGLLTLLAVVLKSIWELWTGQVFFAAMHVGEYGIPLLACHGGGVLGALLTYGVVGRRQRKRHSVKRTEEVTA